MLRVLCTLCALQGVVVKQMFCYPDYDLYDDMPRLGGTLGHLTKDHPLPRGGEDLRRWVPRPDSAWAGGWAG